MTVTAQQKLAYDAFDDALRALTDAVVHYQKVLTEYKGVRANVNMNDAEQLDEAKRAYAEALTDYHDVQSGFSLARAMWVEANPIRVERKARQMPYWQLANVAGKSVGAIQLWERGGAEHPDVQGVENIARFFGQPDLREQLAHWKTLRPQADYPPRPQEIPGV